MSVPDLIAGYRVDGVLGRGADGVVLRVWDERLHRPAALKLLDVTGDPDARARFLIEARAAGQLIHPNVVQVFTVGEHDGRPFLVQELVDGAPLSDLLAVRGKLSAPSVVDVGVQVARGLARAAEAGVVHRDVKPQNLLVAEDGNVKIADFGLAKLVRAPSGITATGTALGTPHYMSPEQCRGDPVDARGDQYALGATLYHLINGRPPFDAEDVLDLLDKHQTQAVPPAEGCPQALAAVIDRMLNKAPEDRYATFAEVIAALEDVLAALDDPPDQFAGLVVNRSESASLALATVDLGRSSSERMFAAGGVVAAVAVILAVGGTPSAGPITEPGAPQRATAMLVPAHAVVRHPPPVAMPRPITSELTRLVGALHGRTGEALVAARALGAMQDQRASAALIAALDSPDHALAAAAATALGGMQDIRAIEPLERAAAAASSATVRAAAAASLRRLWHVEPGR